MSALLYSLARAAFQHRWRTAGIWLLILGALGGIGLASHSSFVNEFEIPGAQSQQAFDRLKSTFPEVAGTGAAVIVVAPPGHTVQDPAIKAGIARITKDLSENPLVHTAISPFDTTITGLVNPQASAALVNMRINKDVTLITDADRQSLVETIQAGKAQMPGAQVEIGGDAFSINVPGLSATEAIGVGFSLVVLILTLGSFIAAGMPLVSALLGVAISGAIMWIATGLMDIVSTTPMLSVMLGLAVGIDYALFILSRHREQLATGMSVADSAARAVATAGSAVVFAGLTVVIALIGLAFAGIPFLTIMGLFAAAAVAIAVAIALTVLPAFMAMAGERMRPKAAKPGRRAREHGRASLWWVRIVTKVPLLTIVLVLGGSVALSWPAKDLALGLPTASEQPLGSASRTTYDLTDTYFGPGYNGQLVVTADIITATDPLGVVSKMREDIEKIPGVKHVALATPNHNADTAFIQIVPETAPTDPETKHIVAHLRELTPKWQQEFGINAAVTGLTAMQIDITDKLTDAMLPFGAFVVGLSLLLLLLVFRSIAVPIKATLGYLLSVGVAFGVTTLVFNDGFAHNLINLEKPGPIIAFLPIVLMGILFGLAMDYEVFLVSRMREEHVHGTPARQAIKSGYRGSAPVVVAAAFIMFFVFAFFVPEGEGPIKAIAFGLAVGVAFDAFFVRLTLVPAIMQLLGEKAWYLPRWLERRLPAMDVEGEVLQRQLSLADWPAKDNPYTVYAENVGVAPLVPPTSLALQPGEILCVQGPAVARSAFLLMLTGRLAPTEGRLRSAGFLLGEQARSARRVCCYLPSDTKLPRSLRLAETHQSPLVVVDDADAIMDNDSRDVLRQFILAASMRRDRVVVLGTGSVDAVSDLLPAGYRSLSFDNNLTPQLAGAST